MEGAPVTGAPRVAVGKGRPGYPGSLLWLAMIQSEIAEVCGIKKRRWR